MEDRLRKQTGGKKSLLSSSTPCSERKRRVPEPEVMASFQIGIGQSLRAMDAESERDLLIQDFMTFECLTFLRKGGIVLPPLGQFKFLNYAPIAFKYFRGLFQIKTEDFINSMCSAPLRQLDNPGASGSTFYLTHDDAYIIKTVQRREAEFLLKLLPGYCLNLTQNPKTFLPKFFGFYCHNSSRSTRIIIMNNLVPTNINISEKYDLKGSTMKRKATLAERKKLLPTFKDLDFMEHHPSGLFLEADAYKTFVENLERDCRVLESFKIIDYSLLLAIHYVDRKPNLKRFTCSSERNKEPTKGIPGRTGNGDEVLLFMGIIDILQSYHFGKKLEHTFKSIVYEKDSISVHRPDFYCQRFQNFIAKIVFRPVGKRKSTASASQKPQVLFESPSCSVSKIVEENALSQAWASSKSKFSKVPTTTTSEFFDEENIKCKPVYREKYSDSKEENLNVNVENKKEEADEESSKDSELKDTKIVPI